MTIVMENFAGWVPAWRRRIVRAVRALAIASGVLAMAAGMVKVCAGGMVLVCADGTVVVCPGAAGPPPNTPICCQNNDCCFDTANGRFVGHYTAFFKYYSTTDGTGVPIHTLLVEFDFDVPITECGLFGDNLNITEPPEYYTNLVTQLDGVDVGFTSGTFSSLINVQIFILYGGDGFGAGSWQVNIFPIVSFGWLVGFTSSAAAMNNDGHSATAGDGVNTNNLSGDCLGIADLDFTNYLYVNDWSTAHDTPHTQWIVRTSHMDMAVVSNYCCTDGDGVCQAREDSPQTAGDGLCA